MHHEAVRLMQETAARRRVLCEGRLPP